LNCARWKERALAERLSASLSVSVILVMGGAEGRLGEPGGDMREA